MDSTIHSKNATNVVNEKQIKFYYTSFPWVPTLFFCLLLLVQSAVRTVVGDDVTDFPRAGLGESHENWSVSLG